MAGAPKSFRWLLFGLLFFLAPAHAEPALEGHWQGAIVLPSGKLEIDVDFAAASGALTGDISIPAQNLRDFALAELGRDGAAVRFKMPGIPGNPSFAGELAADGAAIRGSFYQGLANFPFELLRAESRAEKARAALAEFDAVAAAAVKSWNVPGLGVAVVAGDELIYARGFGFRDVEQKLPMGADTLFAIGSTTKAMTATLLSTLVDQGQLDWDQPLRRYLPSFRLADELATLRVTPRDLLTHRIGLPRHDLVWYNNHHSSREELVARLAHLEATADLREQFQYNNLAFLTAGYLAEKLTGQSWEAALRERLLDPLGMKRTGFSVTAMEQDGDHALPYQENDKDQLERIPYRNIDVMGPAGSVNSSVNEMSHWLRLNLGGGRYDGRQLIAASTLADLHTPHMVLAAPPAPETRLSQQAYGMGWMVEVYRGHKLVEHGGGIDGFTTSVAFFPDDDIGIVAFTNRASGLPNLISREIADRLLGLEKIDWIAEGLTRGKAAQLQGREAGKKVEVLRIAGTRPSHPLANYVGTYAHPGYGELDIRLQGENQLVAIYNDIETPLEHWHYDVWNGGKNPQDATFEKMKYLFRANFDGDIAAVEAPFEPTAAAIVFTKKPDRRLSDPAYLEKLTGTYLGPTGQKAQVSRNGATLTLTVPAQPLYTLVPELSGRFGLRGLQGFSVGFVTEGDGPAKKILFYQPNGVFESQRLEEKN